MIFKLKMEENWWQGVGCGGDMHLHGHRDGGGKPDCLKTPSYILGLGFNLSCLEGTSSAPGDKEHKALTEKYPPTPN